MDIISTANATLTTVAKTLDYFKTNVADHFTDTSLTGITKLTRSEPLTIISQDCANLDYLTEILNNLCSVYSGYYLQSVAILTQVNDVEVVRILDRLNPDRDSTGFLLQGRMTALESIDNLVAKNYRWSLPTKTVIAAEATAEHTSPTLIDSTPQQKTIYEVSNLAVGKLLNVAITVQGEGEEARVVNIPVSVRLSPAILNQDTLTHLFTHRKTDDGIVERFHSWRSGRLSLIKDVIFCQDLINEYRRAAIKDLSGTLNEIVRRVNNNRTFGLLTKNPSLAVSSNLYIISKTSAQLLEAKTGYRLSDARGREKLLEGTYAMVVAVVDIEGEWVTYYFNGISYPASVSVRALKASNKGKGPDVADIMNSLLQGRAPSF